MYVPSASPEISVVVPVPLVTTAPGDLVRVHDPEAGRPLNWTLPDATEHEGWVIVPMVGADGVGGWALITISAEEADVPPREFVTVYE